MNILIWIASTIGQAVLIALALRWIAIARRALRKRLRVQNRTP
jgi:hypothetical protein